MYLFALERVERYQGISALMEPDGRPSLRLANGTACTLTNTTYYYHKTVARDCGRDT